MPQWKNSKFVLIFEFYRLKGHLVQQEIEFRNRHAFGVLWSGLSTYNGVPFSQAFGVLYCKHLKCVFVGIWSVFTRHLECVVHFSLPLPPLIQFLYLFFKRPLGPTSSTRQCSLTKIPFAHLNRPCHVGLYVGAIANLQIALFVKHFSIVYFISSFSFFVYCVVVCCFRGS